MSTPPPRLQACLRYYSHLLIVGYYRGISKQAGYGISRRTDVITVAEEEILWEKGILGSHSPDILRDTMVYMCGLFALCGGSELRSLQRQQITIEKLSSGERYLLYKKRAQIITLEELNIVKYATKRCLILKIKITQSL